MPAPTVTPPSAPQQPVPPAGPIPAQTPPRPHTPQGPDTSGTGSLGGARGSFTRFARTGSGSALGRAVASYVSSGTGGARRAARRMGASRAAARGLLGVVRDVQQLGPVEALRRLNLDGLAGQPAADVFVSMLEFICPPGGTVDEAIARQAMLETIGDLAEGDAGSFDSLTREQLQDFFLDFIVRSIEGRVMADIGKRGITLPDDVDAVQDTQDQLHDFVDGATRGQLAGRLDGLERLSDRELDTVVSQIYETAFDLVAAAGEAAS
ncbi:MULTISPECIES: Qat anti-phage system associated protein QatB [Paraburkholderia]|nr:MULTISPECIES: Qat anti-phage system associated protein QatB [Paraburkholderia]